MTVPLKLEIHSVYIVLLCIKPARPKGHSLSCSVREFTSISLFYKLSLCNENECKGLHVEVGDHHGDIFLICCSFGTVIYRELPPTPSPPPNQSLVSIQAVVKSVGLSNPSLPARCRRLPFEKHFQIELA